MASPPRPRSADSHRPRSADAQMERIVRFADMERPGSSHSTRSARSAWSDDRREDPSRPWNNPSDDMVQSDWWSDARDWWPTAVNGNWESPYRPSSRNSNRRRQPPRSKTVPVDSDKLRPETPEVQPVWPSKNYGPRPMREAFISSTWGSDEFRPKTPQEWECFKVAPAPPPFPETFKRRSWDDANIPWERGSRRFRPLSFWPTQFMS